MNRIIRIILPLVLVCTSSTVLAGKVFKWIDDDGVPQYTDTAPTDREYTVMNTYGAPKSAKAALEKRAERLAAPAPESGVSEEEFEQQKQERERLAKIRAENCKSAQSNLKTMQENARVRILGEDGEFRYLSEEERQQQMDRARGVIEENCGESKS